MIDLGKTEHDDYASEYAALRVLPTGEVAGLMPFLFTTGLCTGINPLGYRIRYCFAKPEQALAALNLWDGLGDPPGAWIKAKGAGIDRPNTFKGIPIRETLS